MCTAHLPVFETETMFLVRVAGQGLVAGVEWLVEVHWSYRYTRKPYLVWKAVVPYRVSRCLIHAAADAKARTDCLWR
jgi:hypothetical protein